MSDVEKVKYSDFQWFISRFRKCGIENQTISDWAGWVSEKSNSEFRETTVDYMPPILAPSTDTATVQHALKISHEATKSINQSYTIVTFDLAVAKKAYSLVWNENLNFENTIVRLGVFHTICSYLGAIGKLMAGSGLAEIVIEAGVCASGSIQKVISGKHYNRSIRVHKRCLEALERLLFSYFLTAHDLHDEITSMDEKEIFSLYNLFRAKLQAGEYGSTAKFLLMYMEYV